LFGGQKNRSDKRITRNLNHKYFYINFKLFKIENEKHFIHLL